MSEPNSARQPLRSHQIFLKLVCAAAPSTGSRVRQPPTFTGIQAQAWGVGGITGRIVRRYQGAGRAKQPWPFELVVDFLERHNPPG